MTPAHFIRLLRTYAYSHTHGNATNGSVPWVGENIDADSGRWLAHDIAYQGGRVNPDGSSASGPFNCSKCAAIRASCTKVVVVGGGFPRSPGPLCNACLYFPFVF